MRSSTSSEGNDAAPATGEAPATGAAPLPAVELLASLPELADSDLLAVPVSDGGDLPSWLTAPAAAGGRRRRHAWRP